MATQDEKGIFVTIRFWTDFCKNEKKITVPKQAWAAGTLYARASKTHGIRAEDSVMFNNLEELLVKLDELMKKHDISLVVMDDKGKLVPRLGRGFPKWTWSGS